MRLRLWRQRRRSKLMMTHSVLVAIKNSIGSAPAETGGMLGGNREDGIIRVFHFDRSAYRTGVVYTPNHDLLNRILSDDWNPRGVHLLGFAHSHPSGLVRPSAGDRMYAQRILDTNPGLDRLLLPIIQTWPDAGHFEMFPFAAVRDGEHVRIEELEIELVHDEVAPALSKGHAPRTALVDESQKDSPSVDFGVDAPEDSLAETFSRARTAYDIGRLASSRVICVGVGGAADFVEQLARAGLAEFVLIDHDIITLSNLGTQQCYRRDIGRAKVAALQERISDINPGAFVVSLQRKLDDIDDQEFRRLIFEPFRYWNVEAQAFWGIPDLSIPVQVSVKPVVTLLCGCTDNFFAQCRINRLGLHFGIPTLAAQVYEAGRGAEITFTHSETTPSCHRCRLRSRYQAFLQDGYRSTVTSDGTPIAATTRLNSLKVFIALAIFHHESNHPRWGGLLRRIADRNLVQIRMDPDLALSIFEKVFAGADRVRLLFDETVWLPQKPDCPEKGTPRCPDCGSTGDLRNARGTFNDTREMR